MEKLVRILCDNNIKQKGNKQNRGGKKVNGGVCLGIEEDEIGLGVI